MGVISLDIPGRPIVKKNTQRIISQGSRRFAIYSPQYKDWERQAYFAVKKQYREKPIEAKVSVHFKFYFKNHTGEADTSNLIEGPQDLLVKAGVLKDDSQVVTLRAQKFFGHEPKTLIKIKIIPGGVDEKEK